MIVKKKMHEYQPPSIMLLLMTPFKFHWPHKWTLGLKTKNYQRQIKEQHTHMHTQTCSRSRALMHAFKRKINATGADSCSQFLIEWHCMQNKSNQNSNFTCVFIVMFSMRTLSSIECVKHWICEKYGKRWMNGSKKKRNELMLNAQCMIVHHQLPHAFIFYYTNTKTHTHTRSHTQPLRPNRIMIVVNFSFI